MGLGKKEYEKDKKKGNAMKSKMRPETQKNTQDWIIIILLLLQVVLSGIMLMRIMNLEELLSTTEPSPVYVGEISEGDNPAMGPQDAPITIIVFSDFQCPYCASADQLIKELMQEYPDQIRFVHRDFPLEEIHPDAFNAALAARCAGEQGKYWEMHDALFSNQGDLSIVAINGLVEMLGLDQAQFNNCFALRKYENRILVDVQTGEEYGVHATPTLFVNGYQVNGADRDAIISIIDDVL
ncbi:MAG: DsbA family protein [Chloroflexi bacterium]|nr:DsbA family protein [Chloroflexota bacterium]